jgi:cyclic pyranopterin phosphate synthase
MAYNNMPHIEIQPDRTARIKIIDACGMACTFCHNEGTAVTSDNRGRRPEQYTGTPGKSGRVAIYTATNGSAFLADRIEPGNDFAHALAMLRDRLDTRNVHFTGGEPTLHPALDSLIAQATTMGHTLNITSNGENGAAVMEDCAKAGLKRINLSVFGTNATELAAVQAKRFNSQGLAQAKLKALDATIEAALTHNVKASEAVVLPITAVEFSLLRHGVGGPAAGMTRRVVSSGRCSGAVGVGAVGGSGIGRAVAGGGVAGGGGAGVGRVA